MKKSLKNNSFLKNRFKRIPAIIFYDVDGTLAEPFMAPPVALKRLLLDIEAMGVVQILCSGKNMEYLAGLARSLGLNKSSLVIAENGVVIFDWQNLEFKILGQSNWQKSFRSKLDPILAKSKIKFYEEPKHHSITLFKPRSEKKWDKNILKVILSLAQDFNLKTILHPDGALDIFEDGLNKSLAIDWLVKEYNIKEENIITCGDGENDLEMLSLGFPVTFKSAHKNVIKLVKERNGYLSIRSAPEGLIEALSHLSSHKKFGRKSHLTSLAYRPWGEWENLSHDAGFKIKKLVVDPGQRLSLQKHEHRSEHWHIVAGRARVRKGSQEFILKAGEQIKIPKLVKHRLENIGEESLFVLEIQSGDYLEEDDIIRLEDDFNRA